jgi:L-ribulose-5-phosphate 3-epimerase UlaE
MICFVANRPHPIGDKDDPAATALADEVMRKAPTLVHLAVELIKQWAR